MEKTTAYYGENPKKEPAIPDFLAMTPDRPTKGKNTATPESAATNPVATPIDPTLKGMIENGKACFGGYLFHRKNKHGTNVVSFAVKGLTETQQTRMENAYLKRNESRPLWMMELAHPGFEQAGEYTILNFNAMSGEEELVNLYTYYTDGHLQKIGYEALMKVLLEILWSLRKKNGTYPTPLNCLSLHTIFVGNNKLRILPLLAEDAYFEEKAPELQYMNGDELSDLYSAAVCAVEVAMGRPLSVIQANADKVTAPATVSEDIRCCTNVIREYRCSLVSMYNNRGKESSGTASSFVGESEDVVFRVPKQTKPAEASVGKEPKFAQAWKKCVSKAKFHVSKFKNNSGMFHPNENSPGGGTMPRGGNNGKHVRLEPIADDDGTYNQ